MKRILFSWIGDTDINACTENPDNNTNKPQGPLMATCQSIQFDEVYLLYNRPKEKVKIYLKWFDKFTGYHSKSTYIRLSDPSSYEKIYPAVDKTLEQITRDNPGAQLSILLSPGTPQMQSISIFLGKTKYSADFIQASVQKGVQEINLPFNINAEYIPTLKKQQDEQLKQIALSFPEASGEFDSIVTRNKEMLLLKKQAEVLAQRDVPVLIYGETGTGKELFAEAIHNASPRKETGKFKAINCGSIPSELVETILFGHDKGSFTGANKYKKGVFEQANNGTLFLDEFGELTKDIQVKLLRVLNDEKQTITPVGSEKDIEVNVRIIAATNKNLIQEIAADRFRQDLFYRVAIGTIKIPPLRDRSGDLPGLSKHLLNNINKKASSQPGYKYKKLSINAINVILNHSWPGNVRELNSVLFRASLWTTSDTISEKDIRNAMFEQVEEDNGLLSKSFTNDFKLQRLIDELQVFYIKKALKESNDNLGKSAKLLGLSNYQTLSNLMKKYDITKKK